MCDLDLLFPKENQQFLGDNFKQTEKLKSCEMKEGGMKNVEGRMNEKCWRKNDEGWMMNDEGWWFQAVEGFCFLTDRQTDWWMNKQTDIGECRVAFATEK